MQPDEFSNPSRRVLLRRAAAIGIAPIAAACGGGGGAGSAADPSPV